MTAEAPNDVRGCAADVREEHKVGSDAYTEFRRLIEEEGGVPDVTASEAPAPHEVDNDAPLPKRERGRPLVESRDYTSRLGQEKPVASMGRFNEDDLPLRWRNFKSEKFEHRIVAFLKAQGFSNKEIAEQTGYNRSYICQVLRLPWVREIIIDEIQRSGREGVETILKGAAIDTVQFFIDTVNDDKASLRERIAAGKEVLNRALGQAAQHVTVREEVDVSKLTDDQLAQIAGGGKNGQN